MSHDWPSAEEAVAVRRCAPARSRRAFRRVVDGFAIFASVRSRCRSLMKSITSESRLSDLSPDAEIVAKGFGLKDPGEVEDVLRDVADALDPRNLREALEGASLEDLVEARDEVRAVLELLNAGTVKLQIQPDILSCS